MNSYNSCKVCGAPTTLINQRYNLVQCSDCQLIFCNQVFSDEELIKTYDELYNKSTIYKRHQNEYINLKSNQNVKLGWGKRRPLQYVLDKNINSICEIGAGVGLVAMYLKKFKEIQYTGIELDKLTALKAQSLGLNVINGSFSILKDLPHNFDAIIGFEVLEHIQDLKHFFELVNGRLRPSGFLVFSVPNYSKKMNYNSESDKLYQDKPPVHLNFFTRENITRILDKSGFSVELLKVKSLPYLNLNVRGTYRQLFLALFGNYEGPTIICVARRV